MAFPTETVYGLGADACNAQAVRRVFTAKGRPPDNPLIAHVADLDTAARLVARPTALAHQLAERWWPGPLTLVVPVLPGVPSSMTGGLDTVAVRSPDHPVARALLTASGLAVAAPSANRSGRPSPTTAQHVFDDLGQAVDVILDGGPCAIGVESTVVDARGDVPVVLRDGAVTREHLGLAGDATPDAWRRSPGTRHRHYAPRCAVEIVAADDIAGRAQELVTDGAVVGVVVPAGHDPGPGRVLASFGSVGELARRLFTALRTAERDGCDIVLVAAVRDEGIGRAVMDRLRRASESVDNEPPITDPLRRYG